MPGSSGAGPESKPDDTPPTRTIVRAGRTVAFTVLGDPRGTPILAAHGSPGSRYQLLPLHEEARTAGVRIIALDRPGVGGTSAAKRSHRAGDTRFGGAAALDAVAVLDALGVAQATALGFSGGAGYALELARSFPSRIARVVLACGMFPGAPRDALAGRIPIVSTLYTVARFAPLLATAMLDGRGPFRSTRAANTAAWPAADRAVMADAAVQETLAADREASASNGSRPAVEDLRITRRSYPLQEVHQPVTLLHGSADGNVPIGVARWAAATLPNAQLIELPELGHYFAVTHPGVVISALTAGGATAAR